MNASGLRGTLSSMGLADLLQWASQARKTGTLVFDKGSLRKQIHFRDGVIAASGSNDPREYLGQFLLRHQVISEDQLRDAMETQRRTGKMLGRVLLDGGLLPVEKLMRLLARKAEETIYSLFLWEDAHFHFVDGETPEMEIVPLALQVEEVLLEGARRYDSLKKVREDFPSDATVLRKTGMTPPADALSHPMAALLYDLVDGARSIADICLEAHAPEYSASLVLHRLYGEGHLEIAAGARRRTPSRGEALVVLSEQAKGMLEKGNFEPALVLLEQIRDGADGNPEVPDLLRRAEAGFVDLAYRHFLPPKKVPVLTRPLESLVSEELTPEEGFLVSRMTGSWDIESIVSISPLREVEVLRILKRLRERMIFRLQDPPEPATT
ncbi:MAG: DUF4388 domain-containing protein [Acidobacteria bacterium]|nr:DUF4388 domain-containing protein [Acidobacteriota bacterium]